MNKTESSIQNNQVGFFEPEDNFDILSEIEEELSVDCSDLLVVKINSITQNDENGNHSSSTTCKNCHMSSNQNPRHNWKWKWFW